MTEPLPSPAPEKPDSLLAASQQETVLFVDDEENILTSLRRLLRRSGYRCLFANSGAEGLRVMETEHVDLIVSDMRMPGMDGAQFLTQARERWPTTVRMLLTGYADISSTIDALNQGGIYRYISKPWNDEHLLIAIGEGVRVRRLEREKAELLALTQQQNEQLKSFNDELERRVKARTEELQQTADMLDLAYEEMKESYGLFVRVFSTVISSRPHLTRSRPQQVADLAKKIALSLKVPTDEARDIYYAALLMDLGKLSLSDDLLAVPESKLGHKDLPSYQRYPQLGEMTLTAIALLEPTARLIRFHTESIDGSGFPDKLAGNQIPRGARILRVARDFIGFQSGLLRPETASPSEAFGMVKSSAGKKYDPLVVRALEPLVQEFEIDSIESNEIKTDVMKLQPGMILARDLLNPNGILLIAKGYKLTPSIIEKLMSIEKLENHHLIIYVRKPEPSPQ